MYGEQVESHILCDKYVKSDGRCNSVAKNTLELSVFTCRETQLRMCCVHLIK